MVSQMVVVDSAAVNTFLTTMFLRHISNRACQTIVYSCLLGQYNLPHVLQVHNVQELPKYDVQVIVFVFISVFSIKCRLRFHSKIELILLMKMKLSCLTLLVFSWFDIVFIFRFIIL